MNTDREMIEKLFTDGGWVGNSTPLVVESLKSKYLQDILNNIDAKDKAYLVKNNDIAFDQISDDDFEVVKNSWSYDYMLKVTVANVEFEVTIPWQAKPRARWENVVVKVAKGSVIAIESDRNVVYRLVKGKSSTGASVELKLGKESTRPYYSDTPRTLMYGVNKEKSDAISTKGKKEGRKSAKYGAVAMMTNDQYKNLIDDARKTKLYVIKKVLPAKERLFKLLEKSVPKYAELIKASRSASDPASELARSISDLVERIIRDINRIDKYSLFDYDKKAYDWSIKTDTEQYLDKLEKLLNTPTPEVDKRGYDR